jgi:hypothetical protein
MWARRGSSGRFELIYRQGTKIMAADVQTTPALIIGAPHLLFEGTFVSPIRDTVARLFAVTADGEKFIFIKQGSSEPIREIRLVSNWFEELKRLVPVD